MSKPPARAAAKRKYPFITQEELNKPIPCVKIAVHGSLIKRGEYRRDETYEDDYEGFVVVPKDYNPGQVKLQTNRMVKAEKLGIRIRTFYVTQGQTPIDVDPLPLRTFMSDQGLAENQHQKEIWLANQQKRKQLKEMEDNGEAVPLPLLDDSNFGTDGLPPLVLGPAV